MVGLLVFGVIVAGIAFYIKQTKTTPSNELKEIDNNYIDSSFFDKKEKPKQVILQEVVTPEEQKEPEVVEKIVYVDRPVEKVIYVPETDIIFDFEEPPKVLNPTEELRQKMLAKRVGKSSLHSLAIRGDGSTVSVKVDNNTNKNWDKFNIPSEIASYPVDMRRVITNDMYIQATLIDAVLSEQPDRVTAVISNNIYGKHGRKILIPAGSTATGFHGEIEAIGDTRVPVTWEYITRPDGARIFLSKPINSSDGIGRAGLPGQIDRRYDEKYKAALLISSISVATNLIAANNVAEGTQINNLTNSLDDISRQIITENADIKPVLTVEQGGRILLKPTTDIWFQEPCGEKIITVPLAEAEQTKSDECEKTVYPG
jgi:type IV secretory pathway VirB10-like protein